MPFDDRLDDILPLAGEAPSARQGRLPTAGEHVCRECGASAGYQSGPPAYPRTCWWCAACVPPGFLPKTRGG